MRYAEACEWLELDPKVQLDESSLKRAFRTAAIREHPDKSTHHDATGRFQRVSHAHQYLLKCIARGETGENGYEEEDDDDYVYDDDMDDCDDDDDMNVIFSVFRGPFGNIGIRVQFAGSDGGFFAPRSGPSSFASSADASHRREESAFQAHDAFQAHASRQRDDAAAFQAHASRQRDQAAPFQAQAARQRDETAAAFQAHAVRQRDEVATFQAQAARQRDHAAAFQAKQHQQRMEQQGEYLWKQQEQQEERKKQQQEELLRQQREEKEREYETFMERMYQQARVREEERRRQKEREEERAKYMAARAEQAAAEGRAFFESWSLKQCMEEAKHRAINIKGKQQEEIVELLIADEAKKRTRRELKAVAPLVDEWAEVCDTKRAELNKRKVRVIDFFEGMYIVEWEASVGSKKSKASTKQSKKARIKPEHLRLWGSKDPPEAVKIEPFHDKPVTQKEMDNFEHLINQTKETAALPEKAIPKMMKIKIKCPKDKKPGDTFDVRNPHAIGQKVSVRVPPNAVPGKSFNWYVHAVEASKEPKKQIKRCAVCARNLDGDNTAVDLRSCPHSTCKTCILIVDGKCCFSCGKPRPTLASLQHLPFIQELQAPESVLHRLLEEYFCRRESEAAVGAENARKSKEALEDASENASKAVNKHYRVTSLKVHPDRHGEEFRAQFEVLTKARDVMINQQLRRSYIDEMLAISCKVDVGYLPRSHEFWIQKHDPDAVEQMRRKKAEPGKRETPLQIDGGILYSKPRKAGISILNNEKRLIEVYLPVSDEHQFLSYCREAIIVGSCGGMEEEEIRLGQINRENIHLIRGEIAVKLYLPQNSIWDIMWYFRLDTGDGQLRDTPHSAEARVDLRSQKQISLLHNINTLDELAKRRAGEIRATIRSYKNLGPAPGREETEARYWVLHRDISKGRSLETKLRNCLQMASDESADSSLVSLHEALEDAALEKSHLEEACEGYIRRDARRSFKAKVAELLEKGEAVAWIKTVEGDDLVQLGGEANRLFQLLVEGRKAHSLMFDGTVLIAAAKRTDLFSAKQCDTLEKRGVEIEEQATEEENRVLEEAKKRDQEAEKLREMEAMASLMPRGTIVRIHGLVSQKTLNGTLAIFMGIGKNSRYTLRLLDTDREISLKQNNFSRWDDESSPGSPAEKPSKIVCSSAPVVTPTQSPTDAQEEKLLKEDYVQKRAPENERPNVPRAAGKPKTAANSVSQTSVDRKPKAAKAAASAAKATPIPDAGQASSSPKRSKKGPRCNMGAKCRFLRKGPHVCRFYHPPQEVASVHGIHPPGEVTFAQVERKLLIEPTAMGHVVGKKGTHIRKVEETSGAVLRVEHDTDQDGVGVIVVSGSEDAVEKAANMVLEFVESARAWSASTPTTSVESVQPSASIISEQSSDYDLTGISDQHLVPSLVGFRTPPKFPPVGLPPRAKPMSVVHSPEEDLRTFLLREEACFKCPPDHFLRWLQSQDILTLRDLSEAISDDDYLNSELVSNGLKKFKRGAFSKSVFAVAANDS